MPSIEVTIKIEHYDGTIEIRRDSTLYGVALRNDAVGGLKSIVACAEASAIAAMRAEAER